MEDYLEMWYRDLMTRTSSTVCRDSEAWGECKRHTGPSYWYAKVKISLGPSQDLRVIDKLDPKKSARLKREGWYDQIVFGVLDVMMTDLPGPYRSFRLTILDADIDEVASRALAFRLAARDATTKMLPDLW